MTEDEKWAKAQAEIAEISKQPGAFVSEVSTPISKIKKITVNKNMTMNK